MQKKFSKVEWSWIIYDWANSVYATNIMAAIFQIYFCSAIVGGNLGLQLWGYGNTIAALICAIIAPILGALADCKGMKKKFWFTFVLIGTIATASLAVFEQWQFLWIGFIISFIGFSGSCLFYDSFLTDVTTIERMDKVSAWGYACGYIGGSTIPFVISIVILLVMGMSNPVAIKISIILTAVWWLIFSLPMLFNVKQIYYTQEKPKEVLKQITPRLKKTIKSITKNKGMLFFILAYFCYIDGVGTVISMATGYGTTLGLGTVGMILALLVTQIVAVPFSILFGRVAKKFGSINLIGVAIGVYFVICICGFLMGEVALYDIQLATIMFWVMAALVGTVQGGIQAISRSTFAQMVDKNKSSEYFGFFDIFSKFATVLGPLLVAVITGITNRPSFGILSIVLLFAIGGILLFIGRKEIQKTILLANNNK